MAMKPSRFFVWIIFGLMAVGMIGFGTTNFGNTGGSIGTVGNTQIDADQYFRELDATLRSFQAATGQPMPIAQAEAFGLTNQALERVISSTALANETQRVGISLSDERLRAQLMQMREFQGVSGAFDPESYEFVLRRSGLTPTGFESSLRNDLARGLLQAAIAGGAQVSPTFTNTLFNHARETRNFNWARLDLNALEVAPGTPTQEDLRAFYEAHPADYTLPQIKHLTYTWLRPQSLLDQVDVSEAELRAYYASRSAEFNLPERRLVERLVFGTTAEAQAAADALAAGEVDFPTLVSQRGLNLSDVDLGDVTEGQLGAAAEAVFALTSPGIVGPEPSSLGPALFRMNAILAAQHTPFEAVESQLRTSLAGDRARLLVQDQVADLDDMLAGGSSLEDLADSSEGMELMRRAWQLDDDVGIAAYAEFREAAAAAQEGDFPELILLNDGGVFALRLDNIDPPRLQDIDEVRPAVTDAWHQAESLELLAKQAQEMLSLLQAGGESLASLGLTEVVEEGLTRSAVVMGTPLEMISAIFSMNQGDWAVLGDEAGVVLVKLASIHAADHTSEDAQAAKAAFAAQVSQEIGLDLEGAFSRALQNQARITLNQAMISAVHRQFP